MKKALIMATAVILVFAMAACGQTNGETEEPTSVQATDVPTDEKASAENNRSVG